MEKLRIIIGGFIGLYTTGGVTWDYIQYPLGFKLLGHEVFYIEDTGQYSYRKNDLPWDDPSDTVEYLKQTMEAFGLEDQWAYRDTFSGQCYGMPVERVQELCASADLFINISDSTVCRDEYLRIPKRVLIDSDPMFTQLQTNEKQTVDPRYRVNKFHITDYNYHFSFGENIGAPDCRIPTLGLQWLPTRQPICFNYWSAEVKDAKKVGQSFTTVMNWSTRSKLQFENEEWGQKDVEFKKFITVPKLFKDLEFKIILAVSAAFKKEINARFIEQYGWQVLEPTVTIGTTEDYKKFIQDSSAEFSAAKETYVKSNSGWFSGRSACYLAAGKPVVTQETRWSNYIPAGEGLFACRDLESAAVAIKEVTGNYGRHAKAAKEIAYEYFDSFKVLSQFLAQLN